jgi:uncharacterized membrane protein
VIPFTRLTPIQTPGEMFMKNLLIVAVMSVFLTACGSDTSVQSTSVTQGQELIDLKKAYDNGIIDEDEYEDSKEAIMERYE